MGSIYWTNQDKKYERVDCNDWVSPQEIHETKSLNQEDIKEKQCRID